MNCKNLRHQDVEFFSHCKLDLRHRKTWASPPVSDEMDADERNYYADCGDDDYDVDDVDDVDGVDGGGERLRVADDETGPPAGPFLGLLFLFSRPNLETIKTEIRDMLFYYLKIFSSRI